MESHRRGKGAGVAAAALGAALLAGACGSGGGGDAPPVVAAPDSAPPDGAFLSDAATNVVPQDAETGTAACVGKEALRGDLDWTLTVGGERRTVHVHLPGGYDPTRPTPVILNFHGLTSNADQQKLLSGMIRKADSANFIAVHPEGTGVAQSWNAGVCCGEAARTAVDDIGFVRQMLDELERQLCVDPRRVFATGMSNGGFLSHRIACELSMRVAAIAPVAGVLGVPTCSPARPVSVFQFHGTLDTLVPYNGNPATGFVSVAQSMSGWAGRNGCSLTPRETLKKGEVTCVTYEACRAGSEVNLCTVTGGGHTWPGGLPVPALGLTTMAIDATDLMWEFFQKHPL